MFYGIFQNGRLIDTGEKLEKTFALCIKRQWRSIEKEIRLNLLECWFLFDVKGQKLFEYKHLSRTHLE